MHKIYFQIELRLDLTGGANDPPQAPIVGWGGKPPPTPLDQGSHFLENQGILF